MSRGDTMKRVEVYIRADDVYVRESRLIHQKSSQSAKGFREAPVKAASPCQGMARHKCDRDLLIPKVQVNHSVTGAPKRSIGKQDITGQSAELGPKNAVRLMAVLEHTLPPSQPTIESKNELRPRWPLVAVCSRQNLNATHGTPEVPPLVWYWKNPMSTEGGRTSQFSIKEREQPRGILTERLSFRVHHRHRRLLCSRRRRPHRGRAAEQRDVNSRRFIRSPRRRGREA
jgi:hypothetical protein